MTSRSAYFGLGLVPRQFQSGETDRIGRVTKRGNPLARTILVECAWASLRDNPWAKGIYDRPPAIKGPVLCGFLIMQSMNRHAAFEENRRRQSTA